MVNNKDIEPRNSKGLAHGLWLSYWENLETGFSGVGLHYKGYYNNSQLTGLFERYFNNGKMWNKHYYNHRGHIEGISVACIEFNSTQT